MIKSQSLKKFRNRTKLLTSLQFAGRNAGKKERLKEPLKERYHEKPMSKKEIHLKVSQLLMILRSKEMIYQKSLIYY